MDKLVYLASNRATQLMHAQAKVANNLANASTVGFRADLSQARAQQAFGEGLPTRVFGMTERPTVRFTPGSYVSTGRNLDVAIKDQGFFVAQGADGEQALTRAGSLQVDENGLLTTPGGQFILGDGGPVALPPFDAVEIATDGTISIRPRGAGPDAIQTVDRLLMVNPDVQNLEKRTDGLLYSKDGTGFEADATVRLVNGTVEQSNVNPVEELTDLIALSREFELNLKMIQNAEENDQSLQSLMQIG